MSVQTIAGLFENPIRGEQALAELRAAGFHGAQLSERLLPEAEVTPQKLENPVPEFFEDHTTTASEFARNLHDLGLSKDDAHYFEQGVERGGVLVTVRVDMRYAEALTILQKYGADLGSQDANAEMFIDTVVADSERRLLQ